MNVTQLIPARLRSALYVAYGVAAVAIGATSTWFATTNGAVPGWVGGVTAVLAYVGGALGFVAAGNTTVTAEPDENLDIDVDDTV